MIELLSLLIASFLATSIGIGISSTASTAHENALMTKMNAKLDFKLAESRADADYKVAISDCKRKPASDKMHCLDEARNVDARLIVAAREKMNKAVTADAVPKTGPGLPSHLPLDYP